MWLFRDISVTSKINALTCPVTNNEIRKMWKKHLSDDDDEMTRDGCSTTRDF